MCCIDLIYISSHCIAQMKVYCFYSDLHCSPIELKVQRSCVWGSRTTIHIMRLQKGAIVKCRTNRCEEGGHLPCGSWWRGGEANALCAPTHQYSLSTRSALRASTPNYNPLPPQQPLPVPQRLSFLCTEIVWWRMYAHMPSVVSLPWLHVYQC